MSDGDYWLRYRPGRRRFLVVAGGLGLASASMALLGCRDTKELPQAVPSPETSPENTTSVARPGGTLKTAAPFDAPSFDPLTSSSSLTHTQIAAYTYPRLFKFIPGVYPESANGHVEGDLVEAFEMSPDRLTLTLRLRQGLRWENRPPTNNRAIDAQDVLFSWNKFARNSPLRGDLMYHALEAPGSPVDTVTSPNATTIVFKLKQADASIGGLLASERLFYVMPRESDSGFDPRTDVRGYGPWLLSENRAGQQRVWTKNPDYYVKGRPFMDRVETVLMPEYGARLAHFKAGGIYTSMVSQDDVIATRYELPELLLRRADTYAVAPASIGFGYNEAAWRDERMRQAVAHLVDRDTLADLRTNRGQFAAAGLDVSLRQHTAVAAGWEGYWVDPLDESKFGPNTRYFRYDVAEAKRLMAAAGFDGGLDTVMHYNGGSEYGPGYVRTAELISGMLYENGIRAALYPHDFAGDWQPNFHFGHSVTANVGRPLPGQSGLIYRFANSQPTVATQLYSTFHRSGRAFQGFSPDGRNIHLGDPDVNRMIEEMRRDFDIKRQQATALDIARYMARKAYSLPMLPFATLNFSLTWPALSNLGVYRGWPGGSHVTETSLHHWLDASKPPLTPKTN